MDRYEVDGLVISTGPVMTTIEPKEDIGSGPVHLSSVLFSGLLMDHDWIETEIYEELRKPEHGKLKEKMEEWPIPILGCPVLKHGVAGQEARAGAYDSRRKSPRGERMMCQECGCDGNTEKAWMDLRHWLHELMLNTDGSAHFVVMDTLEKMRELEGE